MEYTEQYLNSIDEAMHDESFVGKLAAAKTKEQLKELFFTEKGITIDDTIAQSSFEKVEYYKDFYKYCPDFEADAFSVVQPLPTVPAWVHALAVLSAGPLVL